MNDNILERGQNHIKPIDTVLAASGGISLGILIAEFMNNPHPIDALSTLPSALIFTFAIWYPKIFRNDYQS